MNAETRKQLVDVAESTEESDVPPWLRELVVENVSKLVRSNATEHKVANELIGGLRAILDASSPSDDDPIVSRMVSLIEKINSGTK